MPRATKLGGYAIEQYTSPNAGGTMDAHHGTALHIAQGTYRGTISWQMNPNQRYASGESVTTSSTWIVGRSTGEWAQMGDSNRIAWCQRGGSRTWNSIELAGYAPNPPTEWQIEACAQLLVWAHRTHGIPVAIADHPDERGLGHHSMDREWLGEEWGHDSCPGSGVVAAKPAIVTRARAILAGEGAVLMALTDAEQSELLKRMRAVDGRFGGSVRLEPETLTTWAANPNGTEPNGIVQTLLELRALARAAAGDSADDIVAEVRAQGEQTRTALETAAAAEQARDAELRELVEQARSGQLDADEVVRRIGERLTAPAGTGSA